MTEKTLTLPQFAVDRVKQYRAQIEALQSQMQIFVDGVVCGLGADMTAAIQVDLDNGLVTITEPGEVTASPESVGKT